MPEGASGSNEGADSLGILAEYLSGRGPRLLLVAGPPGAGKSSLVRELYPRLPGPKLILLYQQPTVSTPGGGVHPQIGAATSVLLADPNPTPPDSGEPRSGGLAGMPIGSQETGGPAFPSALVEAFGRLASTGGSVVADSWDRESESFARGHVPDPASVRTIDLPETAFSALQTGLLGLRVNLVLAMIPDLAQPLASLSDGLVELRRETPNGASVRVVAISKLRGSDHGDESHLYSLDGGTFRSFPDLPRGFAPPIRAPDPDPEPAAGTLWPGAEAFARAFGRLRYNAITGLALAADAPHPYGAAMAGPLVAHTLRIGGRVIWMTSPSLGVTRVLTDLQGLVPPEWMRERLRIVTATGDESRSPELAAVKLPLRREMSDGGDLRSATSPGVGPIFPEAHRFLRLAPEGAPRLYVLSIEGLKASANAVGANLKAATLPSVLASYLRLPKFHGFGYGRADDPLSEALLPAADTSLLMQIVCGRPVVHGLRPRTPTYVVDWDAPTRPYSLAPSN